MTPTSPNHALSDSFSTLTNMIRFLLGVALGALLTAALVTGWLYAGLPIGSIRIAREGPLLPFPQSIEAGELRVSLGGSDPRSVVITRGSDSFTFTLPPDETCDNPAITPDGRTLFLLVRSQLERGSDYACILRFDFTSDPLSSTRPSRILTQAQLTTLFGGKRTWVNSLYKTSSAGDRLLLNISSEDTSRSSLGSTFYSDRPYWYDINSNSVHEPSA